MGQAPPPPLHVTVEAGNEALEVQWDWTRGTEPAANPSVLGVQLFCQRSQQAGQVFATGAFQPAFASAATLCPAAAPAAARPLPFDNLSPAFLCSPLLPATTTRYRLAGLQSSVPYGVAVAIVDKYGNASVSDPVLQFTAGTDTDGGAADGGSRATTGGGGCSLATGAGHRDGWASFALLAVGALLVGRIRLRRRRQAGSNRLRWVDLDLVER